MINKPKGTNDIYGKDGKIFKYIEKIVDEVMKKYNYNYISTPLFESTNLFHRSVGETSDIVSKETYDFVDRGKRNMTLRPEGTAGVVRSYIENKMYSDTVQPVKLYYNGSMYRYERPQSGRDREFTQFGVEVLGSDDPMVDAEVITVAVNIYKLLGLKEITVNINSLGDKESRDNYHNEIIKYFKPYLNDMCEDCKKRYDNNPLRILDCKIDKEKDFIKKVPKMIDFLNEESKKRFDKVCEYLDILQIPYKIDTNIVRGLDYYNHTVFEITADIKGMGSQNVIGAGGRYNNLVKDLGGPDTPGIGFASGISRLMIALEKENVDFEIDDSIDIFLLYVSEVEKNYAVYLAQELRMNGFKVETEYMSRSLKAQFKQADRLNSKFLSVLNYQDLDNNEIKIKNCNTKTEDIINLDALIYYLDENLSSDAEYNNIYNLDNYTKEETTLFEEEENE